MTNKKQKHRLLQQALASLSFHLVHYILRNPNAIEKLERNGIIVSIDGFYWILKGIVLLFGQEKKNTNKTTTISDV